MDIEKTVEAVMLEEGVFIDPERLDEDLELDSIQFVSMIIGLEEQLGISIPDDNLDPLVIKSYVDVCELVMRVCSER